ncbi:DNA polymerase epsilon noncatalytic subunit NDAI_0J00310 [Naumovozyma dairenensis CBS 421]|uniref:DNA polymerase epsilon subunit B n=1 Tax=Naumovozyma dairenensis (strain ATCC 10597 / BCRC 20456 / CBS 421 / NBRC 0211 / NRRL Y-12639) TaxID=1071378 RepID=G0WGJ5_NAUDC|nr:hypothetical protein NDAI_0J00310 [Naumovozyma dairenensis CBS 421]CCD26923.1 hypothetical protein NDAI_0J00310 [Naumovozyma dairenensis CBS 421]
MTGTTTLFATGNVLPVKIQPPLLRPMAYRILSKKFGLSIKSDGLASLAEFIGLTFGSNWKKSSDTLKFLENFATIWKQQERGLFVDQIGVNEVILEMKEREKTELQELSQSHAHGKMQKSLARKHSNIIDNFVGNHNTNIDDHDIPMDIDDINDLEPSNDKKEQLNWKDYFKVINAHDQQRFIYNSMKMQFQFQPNKKKKQGINSNLLHLKLPNILSNISLFQTRYYLNKERIMRNENFQNTDSFNPLSSMIHMKNDLTTTTTTTTTNQTENISSYMSITPIKNLLGRDGKNFLILGLLKKNSKGNWSIEDPSSSIEIEISQTTPTPGVYYVPGCIVLAEGIYFSVGNKFHVISMTLPPAERREITLDAIGNLDLLGMHNISNENYIARLDSDLKIRLHFLEKELEDHRFIILGGDLFLDELTTLEALRKVFDKINDDPPTIIIFQGSFTSIPIHASMTSRNISSTTQYKNNFDLLANLLSNYENIINECTLIFIPGVNDPWGSMVSLGATGPIPQNKIPSYFINRMNRICKNIIWGSNPTRILYLSQEIVIMRDDMADRFKRNSITFPMQEEMKQQHILELQEQLNKLSVDDTISINQLINNEGQLNSKVKESRRLVKTILDQGHLSPFITNIRPVIWDLEHSLTLYPIPSTMIICDLSSPQFDLTYNGCKSINPGRFMHKRRARYVEYKPSLKKITQEEVYF